MASEAVAYYLAKAKSGDVEEAFHGLRGLDADAIAEMRSAFDVEPDPIVRELIVDVIWRYRQTSVIDFVAVALQDPAPAIWKKALDVLVVLRSPESIAMLRSALDRESDPVRRDWIEEAIDQAVSAEAMWAPDA